MNIEKTPKRLLCSNVTLKAQTLLLYVLYLVASTLVMVLYCVCTYIYATTNACSIRSRVSGFVWNQVVTSNAITCEKTINISQYYIVIVLMLSWLVLCTKHSCV